MKWKRFVRQWRQVDLVKLGVPVSTVAEWRSGAKEPKGWQRKAAELWISSVAGNPTAEKRRARKSGKA